MKFSNIMKGFGENSIYVIVEDKDTIPMRRKVDVIHDTLFCLDMPLQQVLLSIDSM